jgi:hypothetical protein
LILLGFKRYFITISGPSTGTNTSTPEETIEVAAIGTAAAAPEETSTVSLIWYVHSPSLWFHLLEFKSINYEIVTWFMEIYKYIIIFS